MASYLVAMPVPLHPFSPATALREQTEAARPFLEIDMQQQPILPITKYERRAINDKRAVDRYRRRLAIDSLLADRKLEKQLQEVWQ